MPSLSPCFQESNANQITPRDQLEHEISYSTKKRLLGSAFESGGTCHAYLQCFSSEGGSTDKERKIIILIIIFFSHLHLVSFHCHMSCDRPPLWSSGQSSWLQIRRPGFDSRHYQKKKNSSGSGTGSTQPCEYN
jgi:hypothetical protein